MCHFVKVLKAFCIRLSRSECCVNHNRLHLLNSFNKACIIGWFALIGNILLAVFALFGVVFLSINNCYDLAKLDGSKFSKLQMCTTLRGGKIVDIFKRFSVNDPRLCSDNCSFYIRHHRKLNIRIRGMEMHSRNEKRSYRKKTFYSSKV